MLDESTAFRMEVLKKMQKSIHLFVCITRAMILHFDYHLKGIYNVYRINEWFAVTRAESLPLLNRPLNGNDIMVTESSEFRSEHQMLYDIGCKNIVAAGGRDRIESKLRKNSSTIIVFSDLSAIGRAYRLLQKRCKLNKNISFYEYESFEQMLCSSPIFSDQIRKSNLNPYQFITLERYYEALLSEITGNSEYKYIHGKPLPKIYSESWSQLLDSNVGKPLLDFIKGNNEKSLCSSVKVISVF